MVELYDVTILLKDPSVDKVSAALRNLRNLGVLFPTQLSCQAIHGMASAHVVSQLEQARDVLVLSRRLEIVKAEVTRTVDAATALREIEEKETARREAEEAEQKATLKVEESQPEEATAVEAPTEDLGKKKKPKKKPAKKPVKKAAPKKAKSQRKAKNKRKAANRSKRQNRRNR